MIERLLTFLAGMEAPAAEPKPDELELAVAALLIEAARMDDDFDAAERATTSACLPSGSTLRPKPCARSSRRPNKRCGTRLSTFLSPARSPSA